MTLQSEVLFFLSSTLLLDRYLEYCEKTNEKISLVQQEPVLFARTIRENIAYECQHDLNQEGIVNTAIMTNIYSFISYMPHKNDIEAGEKGMHLLGGQKDQVAILGVLIQNLSILILDKVTSALHSEREYLVRQAIIIITRSFSPV